MVDPGLYPKPIPFGGMGDPVNENGFSDHFPITMTVIEVEWGSAWGIPKRLESRRLLGTD
jgi:hypothetical protein